MKEEKEHKKYYELSQLMESISSVISRTYYQPYWIKAEMIKLNHYSKTNHCYPDLVEKSDGKIKAQIRATLWSNTFFRLNAEFVKKTGKALSDGMNILFLASVKHDALHGLTLNIVDIDVDYQIGQLAKAKNDCIARLKKEGLFDLNKKLSFPLLPKRIAIISVNTSKGYQDFMNIIDNNSKSYKFFHMLFPALLQGDAAVASIVEQLNRIEKVKHHFDIVAIIRGGGGDVGLSCYDDYELTKVVAQFPLPVISGIGHATNETVVEMVANFNPITPTDLAYFLIHKYDYNNELINKYSDSIIHDAEKVIAHEYEKILAVSNYLTNKKDTLIKSEFNVLDSLMKSIGIHVNNKCVNARLSLNFISKGLRVASKNIVDTSNEKLKFFERNRFIYADRILSNNDQKINHIEEKIALLNPKNLLKKGYSLSLVNGKPLVDSSEAQEGDELITRLYKGKIKSKITNIEHDE